MGGEGGGKKGREGRGIWDTVAVGDHGREWDRGKERGREGGRVIEGGNWRERGREKKGERGRGRKREGESIIFKLQEGKMESTATNLFKQKEKKNK